MRPTQPFLPDNIQLVEKKTAAIGQEVDLWDAAGPPKALCGHGNIVRVLVEHGANVNTRDLLWQGTPGDWARHEGRREVEAYLRGQETKWEA